MRFGKYTFHFESGSAAELPPFKGSMLHGAFGHSLKRIVCVLRGRQCTTCLLKESCLYPRVFETRLMAPPGHNPKTALPHPFVLEPPTDERTVFQKGDSLAVNLLLFGEVNTLLPYFVHVFDKMGEAGMGRRVNGRRTQFHLSRVSLGERIIYTDQQGHVKLPNELPKLSVEKIGGGAENKDLGGRKLRIELETPLRLKFANRLAGELPFHVLVRAMLRRAAALLTAYGGGEPALDYQGMVRLAEKVPAAAADITWTECRRYSNRQKTAMQLGGLTGWVEYDNVTLDFQPLIDFCSRVHIGKQTTFGLGKMHFKELLN